MKKQLFRWMFALAILLPCLLISVSAETVLVPLDVSGLESEHEYAKNFEETWTISRPGALSITLTFDSRTSFDVRDYLYIYDNAGKQVGKYADTSLAGKTITVSGDRVRLKLDSYDKSSGAWGFKVVSAMAAVDPDWRATVVVGEVRHGSLRVDKTTAADGEMVTVTAVPEDGYHLRALYVNGQLSGSSFSIPYVDTGIVTVTADFLPIGTIEDFGSCGDAVCWAMYESGELYIYGSGDMFDYDRSSADQPWSKYVSSITDITVDNGVTGIGMFAFYDCEQLASVTIGTDVVLIGIRAFHVSTIGHVFYMGDAAKWETIVDAGGNGCITNAERHYITARSDIVTVTTEPCENGTVSAPTMAAKGEKITVTAAPATGYKLNKLYANGVEQAGRTFAVPGNSQTLAITAEFVLARPGETMVSGGSCGADVYWTLYENGELYIYGEGDMDDLYCCSWDDDRTDIPWWSWHDAVKTVTIEAGVTYVGSDAFYECTSLTSLTLPDSVTTIGSSAFSGCTNLTSLTLPDSVTTIGSSAFSGCTNLTSITIPDSVTEIIGSAFENCTSLTIVVIPEGVSEISDYMFKGCTKLTTVVIGNDSATIGSQAFYNCGRLSRLEFLSDAPISVASDAFYNCICLTTYYHEGTVGWPTNGTWQGYPLVMIPMEKTYQITVSTPANGTLFVDRTSGKAGETVTVMTSPASGYLLDAILVDGKAINGNSFTISGNHTVTASFVKKPVYTTSFAGTTVSMTEVLDLNFMFNKSTLNGISGAYAELDGPNGLQTVQQADWGTHGSTYYKVTYQGLSARQMTDEITVTVYNSDGTPLSDPYTNSIRDYAGRALASSSADAYTKTLIVDMLNYGAAAQVNFKYNTGDLANALLTDAQKALGTNGTRAYSDKSQKIMNNVGSTFNLASRLELNMYFNKMTVTDDVYALVKLTHHNGTQQITVRIDGSEFNNAQNNYTIVPIAEIVAADGRQLVTCEVYEGNTMVAKGVDSLESYVARAMKSNATTNKWLEEVLDFSDSAYNFLHNR